MNVGSISSISLDSFFVDREAVFLPVIALFVLCFAVCIYRGATDPLGQLNRFAQTSENRGEHETLFFEESRPLDMLDTISRHCHLAAQAYALSAREEEVLGYLVRGKSAKSIAKEAYISYNTVKTHIGHIYKKFDVHTREDLLREVENCNA